MELPCTKYGDGKPESGLLTGKRFAKLESTVWRKWRRGVGLQGKENIFKLKTSLIQMRPQQHFPFTLRCTQRRWAPRRKGKNERRCRKDYS